MATGQDEHAESSKQGAQRMRQLRMSGITCGQSPSGCIDPITSTLVYQAPSSSPYSGHLVTPLSAPLPPRQLPLPSSVTPGRDTSVSPDGRWVVIFHPNNGQPGGLLGVYDASILSPCTTAANVVPLTTFSLPTAVLSVHHNYPPRLYTSGGRGPSTGPKPPVTYDPVQGPSLTALCADGIYLFHPFQVIDSVTLDSAGNLPVDMLADSTQPGWRMQMLKCPLHTRFRAVMGGSLSADTGLRASRGWLGAVAGSEAVWAGMQVKDEIRVIRVEYALDQSARFSMTTIPLPPISITSLKNRSALSPADDATIEEFQGLAFMSRAPPRRRVNTDDSRDAKETEESTDKIGVVVIFSERSKTEPSSVRTRLKVIGVERQEVLLADGFKDLASDGVEAGRSWDWQISSRQLHTLATPEGWSLIALHPLSSLTPPSIALALIQTPRGLNVSHFDMMDSSAQSTDEGRWAALRGASIVIQEDVDPTELGLVVSQGVARGEQGLIAITNRDSGAILLAGPALNSVNAGTEQKIQTRAESNAASIVLAMKQECGWSDVVRAAFSSVPVLDRRGPAEDVVRHCYQQILEETDLDELKSLFSVQVAVYDASNHHRQRDTAADLLRLLDASYLFSRCAARGPNRKILFDLDSIWPLIHVADWVSGVLAAMMREAVLERAKYQWFEDEGSGDPIPARILYLLHPSLRALVLRLHTQLHAFVNFVLSLDQPIAHAPNPAGMGVPPERDSRATVLAKENVRDVLGKEGVDLLEWGKAIQDLGPGPRSASGSAEEDKMRDALLTLSSDPIRHSVKAMLESLPASSALFRTTSDFASTTYDGITLEPIPYAATRLARCARCGWKTAALGDGGWAGMGKWGEWRRAQERSCICGGVWIRENKR